jgi:hypothetical protein
LSAMTMARLQAFACINMESEDWASDLILREHGYLKRITTLSPTL